MRLFLLTMEMIDILFGLFKFTENKITVLEDVKVLTLFIFNLDAIAH